MRHLTVPAALVLLLSAASPAFAGAGIPKIASVKVGAYEANLYNSSPGARTGANTFTVEIPNLEHGSSVTLQLTGPGGEKVQVPLKTLRVLGGAEAGHDEEAAHGDAHGSAAGHGSETSQNSHDSHSAPKSQQSSGHGHAEETHTGAFLMRGTARLTAGGDWKAFLEIVDSHGEKASVSFPLHAENGGPNRIFISFSGLLMGGTILYGMAQRSRQSSKGGNR